MTEVPVLLADGGFWPIVVFAIIAMLLGGGKKKTGRTTAPPVDGEQGGGGLMSELSKALEELKRAEREAARGEDATTAPTAPPPAPTVRRTSVRIQGGVARELKGGELVRRQVFMPKPKPSRPAGGRFVRATQPDPDQAFEDPTVVSLEQRDYDDEAEKVVTAREAFAARRAARREESVEEMSAAQKARRADRAPAQAIGGRAEHAAWHEREEAATAGAAVATPAAGRLGRFVRGRMKDAVVLSEILGKPVSQR